MKFILKVDDNDMFRSADIRDLNAVETLVINSALRRYSQDESVHESDRKVAERIGYKIIEQAQTPSRPLTSIDGADRKTENSSEKPNNCEHITEDGVTCAKYPACDDCLHNPLNKVKGSEQTDCQTCKWWSSYGYCVHRECKAERSE